jgi:hypothetical protein
MASSDANGMVIYLGNLDNLFPSFQTGFVVAQKIISEAKNYLLDRQGDLTQNKCYLN